MGGVVKKSQSLPGKVPVGRDYVGGAKGTGRRRLVWDSKEHSPALNTQLVNSHKGLVVYRVLQSSLGMGRRGACFRFSILGGHMSRMGCVPATS